MTAQQMWTLICNSQTARGMVTLDRFPFWSELNDIQRAALEEARDNIVDAVHEMTQGQLPGMWEPSDLNGGQTDTQS